MFGIVFIQKGIQFQIQALKTNVWFNCHLLPDHGNCCLVFPMSYHWHALLRHMEHTDLTSLAQLEHHGCASG